jgi:hypothetical protein
MVRRWWWLMLLGLTGFAANCAEIPTKFPLPTTLLAGQLLEARDSQGQVRRLWVQGTESWLSWDTNSTRDDDGGLMVRAELSF